MKETVIKQSFLRSLWLSFLGVLSIAVSIFVYGHPRHKGIGEINDFDIAFAKIIGILGFVFATPVTLFFIYRLFAPKNVLIINEVGFIDNSSIKKSGIFIEWKYVKNIEIKIVETGRASRQTFISVKLDNEGINKFFNTETMGIFSKIYNPFGLPDLNITLNLSKEKPHDAIKIMQNYLDEYRLKNRSRIKNS